MGPRGWPGAGLCANCEYSGGWAVLRPEFSPEARRPPTMHQRHQVGVLNPIAGPACCRTHVPAGYMR
jgi:hypothetical protein